jgi:hypothetical protein
MARGFIESARAIFAHALSVFPQKKSIWIRAAFLEKNHGTRQVRRVSLQAASPEGRALADAGGAAAARRQVLPAGRDPLVDGRQGEVAGGATDWV